jgi:hypothetical protein
LADDAVGVDELSATGTASSSTFLRGDNAWVASGLAWQSVTTGATLTAVAGRGYPINTTSNVCTVSLPATASVGDTIEFVDYAGTWDTNRVILDPQSLNLNGASDELNLTYDRQGVRIVYVDATQGWVGVTGINETPPAIASFAGAGGTVTTYTDGGINYKTHTFTTSGTFTVTGIPGLVDVMLVGGGGGGHNTMGGAGGGGGMITMVGYTAPLGDSAIVIGAGGAGVGNAGASTTGFGETCTGGGCGGLNAGSPSNGGPGANGGAGGDSTASTGGVGTAPSVVSGTATGRGGNNGGRGGSSCGGGGGGIGAAGGDGHGSGTPGGDGGAGLQWNLDGNNYYWGGGGGGACYYGQAGDGGIGGGGTGTFWTSACSGGGTGSAGSPGGSAINTGGTMSGTCGGTGGSGGANTGGGGSSAGGAGGSGIVQIRYRA